MRTLGRAIGAALLLMTAPGLHAQSGQATEFWKAVGRYVDPAKPDLPNISGKYDLQGSFEDQKWTGQVVVKRMDTYKTPQGAKFNLYHVTWIWSDGKQPGVAVLLGKRLYAGYGSENLALHIMAPFTLEEAEKPAWNKYVDVFMDYEKKGGGNGKVWIKNAPWFAELVNAGAKPPAYYDLWLTPKGYFGHEFVMAKGITTPGGVPAWAEGDYAVGGIQLDDDGEPKFVSYPSGRFPFTTYYYWRVAANGDAFGIRQRADSTRLGKDMDMNVDDDLDGQAMVLDDGTVVSVMGGNDGVRVMAFDVKDGKFVGQRTDFGTDGRAMETWAPEAGIVSKNAQLFGK